MQKKLFSKFIKKKKGLITLCRIVMYISIEKSEIDLKFFNAVKILITYSKDKKRFLERQ